MEKRQAQIREGLHLAYTEQGQGTPVVLLHGFCGSSAYWERVLPTLGDGARYIVPDLRGHGASGAPDEAYTIEAMAGDIAALLDKLAIRQAVLLGHSLGGYITLAFAEQYADRLLGFGLIHSTAFPDDEKAKQGRLNSMQTIREQGLDAFIEGLVPKLFAPAHLNSMPEAVERAKAIGRGTNAEGAIRTLEAMRGRPDRNRVLETASVPLLLVAGEQDQIIPTEKTLTVSGSHVQGRQLADVGHMSMMEHPERLAETIDAFVRRTELQRQA